MVFKWRINRPAFQAAANGVDVMHPGIETEFETGSIAEAHGIFTDSATALAEMFGSTLMGGVNGLTETISGEPDTNEQTPARRGRGKAKDKSQPDPSTATAPPPVTIPGAEAPPTAPTIDTTLGSNGIPAFLDATKQASAATAAISAPPPPPAPPAAPAAPPTGIVAGKIVAELERRAVGSVDNGQGLADWLSTTGITIKGASFEEAVKVMRLQPDEKLGQIAGLLGV